MELKAKLDRQVQLAVRDTVGRLSRGEAVDAGSLALALASGETADSLAGKAQEKIDSRAKANEPAQAAAKPAEPAKVSVATTAPPTPPTAKFIKAKE